jgi:hypothetical protein
MAFTKLEKTDMVCSVAKPLDIRQIYGERFPQRILPNARSWPPAEAGILVAEEDIPHEIENQPLTSSRRLTNHLGVSQFVVWLRVQNAAQNKTETF